VGAGSSAEGRSLKLSSKNQRSARKADYVEGEGGRVCFLGQPLAPDKRAYRQLYAGVRSHTTDNLKFRAPPPQMRVGALPAGRCPATAWATTGF